MRVDDARVRVDGTSPQAARGPRAAGAEAAATSADRVELSAAARVLAGLRDAIGGLDEVREELIAGLRPVVGAGRYHVAAEAVARDFLAEELGGLLA
jgi:anti-sigma28 factor (negative regulator of flagellin synthesis)